MPAAPVAANVSYVAADQTVTRSLCSLLACVALTTSARAESVPIGRYGELRAGTAVGHPWAMAGGEAGRTDHGRG